MSKASDFLLGKVSASDENDEVIQPNTTDITGDSAWKYIDAGDISGFADWTNRNMNYRDIPFIGQIVGHTADATTQGIADAAQFVGADGVSNYLNEKAQEGESYLPPMATPELSFDYVTDPNGLASATGMLVGSMLSMAPATMLVPESAALKVGSLLKGLPKIGTVASGFAPKAVKWAATGPVEAAMEGGNTERQMLQNGATPEEAKQAAWDDFYGNVGLLTTTNALEGGLLGKVARVKTPTFQNGLLNTASKMAGYAPATAAEAALQGYEEGAQQGIQEGAMDGQMDMNHILNPNAWDGEQWENAKFAVAGGLPLVGGSALIRHVGGRGNNATGSAEDLIAQANASTQAKLAHDSAQAQTAEQATAQPAFAVVEPETAQESAGGLPTYGQKFYTITDEVSDTALDDDTEARLNILAHDYQAQFGEPLQVTSMKRNGGGGSWHDSGQAFDLAGGGLETNENGEREWLMQRGQQLGLTPLDEYAHPSEHATGGHIHFSNHEDGSAPAIDGASMGGGLTLSSGDQQIDAWIQEAADAHGVPANLLSALLDVESGYNVDTPNSEAGAIGITQFMPGTADAMGIDPRDPHQAIDGAARLLKQEYDHYGNWSQALEAYNGGEGNVGSGETQEYAQKVLGKAGDISHLGGGSRSSASTNFLNEKPSFDINSDDAEGRKMISDFIDYWGNRANVDDADTIQGMLDANGKFRNTQENRDTVREKWGDELQQYADEHMPDEQQQARQETQAQKQAQQQADAARRAAQGSKKATSASTKDAIDTSTSNLDAAKQQKVDTTPQTQADTADETQTAEAAPQQPQATTNTTAQPPTANATQAAPTTQAKPVTQAQPTAQAAPIEQAKAPNVQKNETPTAQQPAQPQTPTMDAQQAAKQDNTLPQPAQTPQAAAQQKARAAKEQRLRKELETNASIEEIERGQQLEAAAKQAGVTLPKGMAGSLHRGQAPAIAQATELLQRKGVSLPTVEASGNTVYGAENGGRGNSAQAQAASPLVETGTHVHTKTGKQMPVARLTRQISKEEYKDVAAKAKKHGGRYDGRYAKGFLFKDEAGRDAFAEEVNHETKKSAPLANDSKAQEQPKKAAEKDQTSEPRADFFHVKLGGVDAHVDTAALDAITKKYPRIKDVIAQKLKSAETNKNDAKWLAKLVQMNDDERAEAALGYVYNQVRVNYEVKKVRGNKDADMEVKLMTARSVMNDFKKGDITPQEAYRELDQLLPETKPADLTGLDVDEHAKVKTKAETQESKDAEAFQHATDAMDKAEAFFDGTKKSLESVQRAIDNAIQGYMDGSMVSDARRISQLENYGDGIVRDLRKKVKEKESPAPQAKAADTSIFGSVEDADKELFEEFGIQPDEEETFTAPDGIENTAEVRAQLEKELTAELNKLGANPVFNPKIYELGVRIAFTYVKDGINTAKKLVATLEAKFGDKIGPWAPAIVETVRTWPKGVAFDAGKVRALSKAVGARYEKGIQTREGMHADMKKTLGGHYDSFAPMIDAAYNGIERFFHPEKEVDGNGHGARPGESVDRRPEVQQSREVRGAEEEGQSRGHRGGIPLEGEKEGGRVLPDDDEAAAEGARPHDDVAEVERDHDDRAGAGERGNHELASLRDDQAKPAAEKAAGHPYEIKGDGTAKRTPAERYKGNVKAIQLLKKLEAENRMPTPQEQKVLAAYSGWGGLTNAFKDGTKENNELRKLLTKDEYDAAKRSILDAYFTPPAIVRAIWKGVSSLGFHGGRVLDPSMGVGNFFGCMPRDMMKASALSGVELDSLTSRFAKMLYPNAHIENTGFQNASLANNFFDLVISNIPFGQSKIGKYSIHNFFFAQGIDKVRPGGLMVFVTSQSALTGSKDAATMRSYLAGQADLLGAFKLPSGVFKSTGTDVATDVLVFQKRGTDKLASKNGQNFLGVKKQPMQKGYRHGEVTVNEYFKNHPENILGTAELGQDPFGNDVLDVKPKDGQDAAKALEKAMKKLPKDAYQSVNRANAKPYQQKAADVHARAGEKQRDRAYFTQDGKVYQNQDGTAVPVTGKKATVLKAYLGVKDALQTIFIAQNDPNAKEATLDTLRKKLGKQYDAFVAKHGYLNDPANVRQFGDDPMAGTVLAIETNVQTDGKGAKRRVTSADKSDIFYQRTMQAAKPVTHADSAHDALLASLNQTGKVDIPYMAKLTGKTPEAVVKELGDTVYQDPVTQDYQTADEYLSGNVREKLAQAQEAAKTDPRYQKNVDALQKAVPADLVSSEILVNMNAPWLPEEDLNEFMKHLAQGGWGGSLTIRRVAANGKYIVEGYAHNQKWETDGADLKFLIDRILNNKTVEVYGKTSKGEKYLDQKATDAASAAADRIRDEFRDWIWSDKAREKRLVKYYNENYNGDVLRKYDGSHLTFPGMNSGIRLRAHQKNIIWRILQKANTLIAHCVGAGKTFEMQAAGMEMRRLGIANKPLYCVPNNVVEQFARDFRKLYPNAKLLVLKTGDDIPEVFSVKATKTEDGRKVVYHLKPSEMKPADRKKYEEKCLKRMRALSRIQTEDWDGIIMSHNMFERLPISGDTRAAYIKEELETLERTLKEAQARKNEGKDTDGREIRNLEKRKEDLQNRLDEALSEDKKAVGIPFEELGIDQIFVDEADMFKNLHFTTSIGGVSGLTNSNANRSTDMFVKTQWLTKTNGGRGVVFATGTPISNTMAEMYTMMRYLDRDGLKAKGLDLFDNWIRMFADIGTGIERKPTGDGFRKVNKVKNFINVSELTKMFRKFTDVFTRDELEAEDPDIKIPKLKNGKKTVVSLPVDPAISDYIKNVVPQRLADIKKNSFKKAEEGEKLDNMLSLTNDLRAMSMTDAKIDACAERAADKYRETEGVKGAQLIFCDMGIPRAEKESATSTDRDADAAEGESENTAVYDRLIARLIAKGIPREQIAFVQKAKNKQEQDALFQKVDNGDIRILIGSTQKMGAGTNCQHHLVAEHHLDAPWRPRDIEQREGRILRQGNENSEVEIFTYVVKDSFDANMWEKLKNKASIIGQAMSDNAGTRTIEDADLVTLSYADVEGAATGNPLIRQKLDADAEVTKYTNASVQFQKRQRSAEQMVQDLPKTIAASEDVVKRIEDDAKARVDTHGDKFQMEVGGKTYTKRTEADAALASIPLTTSPQTVGHIAGFEIHARQSLTGETKVSIVRNRAYPATKLNAAGIENAMRGGIDKALENRKGELEAARRDLQQAQETLKDENPYTEKLKAAREKQRELDRRINSEMTEGGRKATDTEAAPTDTAKEKPYNPDNGLHVATKDDRKWFDQHVIVAKVPDKSQNKSEEQKPTRYESADVFSRTALWDPTTGKAEPSARLTIHADDFIMGKLIPFAEKYEGGYYDAKQKRFFFENEKSRDAFVRDATNFINFNSEHVHYSVSEGDQRLAKAQTMDDLNKATQKVFPGSSEAEHTTRENDDGTTQDIFKFRLANGTDIEIHTGENINLPEREKARARREHGIDEGKDITVNGMEQSSETAITVNGRTVTKSSLARIVLSKFSDFTSTLYHEAFHVAYDLFLTNKEKAAIEHAYSEKAKAADMTLEEYAADRYRDWVRAKLKGLHVAYGKIWQKVSDGAEKTVEYMEETEETARIFREIESGKIWERPLDRATRERHNEVRERFWDEISKELASLKSPTDADLDRIFLQSRSIRRTLTDFFFKVRTNKDDAFEASSLFDLLGDEFEHDERISSTRQQNSTASLGGVRGRDGGAVSRNAAHGSRQESEGSNSAGVQPSAEVPSVLGLNDVKAIHDYYNDHKAAYRDRQQNNEGRPNEGGLLRGGNEQETRSSIHYSAEEADTAKRARETLHKLTEPFARKQHLKGDVLMDEVEKGKGEDITSLQSSLLSPSRVASKVKTFRVLYTMADRAMNKLVSLRNDFGRKYDKALSLVSSKDDRTALFDMLLRGDAEGKEWTRQELLDEGVKENVADAYIQIRRQLNKAYHLVNNARRAPVGKSETVDGARLKELRHSNFVDDLSVTDKGNGKYLVSYKEYRNYPTEHKGVDAEAVEAFRKNPGMDVVDVVEAGEDGEGRKLYDVKTLEGPADLHKLTGYIPHFFHEYLILAPDGDGMKVVGSGRTQREAIQKAEAYKKEHPLGEGEVIRIRPKTFNINEALGISEDEYLPIVGDKDFRQVQENLAKQNDMTLDEAKDMLDGTMRRKGRHRFFGNALHRKGAEGFETDLNWALRHYFNSASRYVAMETEFKPKAISFFERVFGAFDKDYKDNALARYCKDYINDINGNPSALEQRITKLLTKEIPGVRWMFKNVITPTFGDRAALTLGNSIANKVSYLTLGLNMSSALLNFTQLMNSAAYLGDARTLITMVAKGLPHRKHGKEPRYSMHELRVLHEAGVFNDIGLDSGSGYDRMRGGGETLGTGKLGRTLAGLNNGIDYFGSKSMRFFQEADAICRRGTVLAAYEKARKEGKSHAEAIAYARDINYKANFQYGVQDAANIFRRGSILSQMLLQFKKYGMKELEVMHDFTFSNKTSKKQKLLFWGMYAMLCGAMGIPALDWLDDILGEKLGWAYPKDAIQKFFINNFPKPVAKMLMYGGAAVLNANLSNRAGLSDVIPTSLGDFAGPTLSKSARFISDLHDGAWANALRDVSPGLYNMYAAASGESRGKRDRLNDRYVTAWDRILRAVGFRSVDETIPTDMQRIINMRKTKETQEKQDAIDAYLEDPSTENAIRLKELGVKPKAVADERKKKQQSRRERTQSGMSKPKQKENEQLIQFGE